MAARLSRCVALAASSSRTHVGNSRCNSIRGAVTPAYLRRGLARTARFAAATASGGTRESAEDNFVLDELVRDFIQPADLFNAMKNIGVTYVPLPPPFIAATTITHMHKRTYTSSAGANA